MNIFERQMIFMIKIKSWVNINNNIRFPGRNSLYNALPHPVKIRLSSYTDEKWGCLQLLQAQSEKSQYQGRTDHICFLL